MSDELYRRLARHLDDLPGSFPATESGVERRILRRLFTPDQARLAVHLTLIPEAVLKLARAQGKLGSLDLVSTGLRSKSDRLMARERRR